MTYLKTTIKQITRVSFLTAGLSALVFSYPRCRREFDKFRYPAEAVIVEQLKKEQTDLAFREAARESRVTRNYTIVTETMDSAIARRDGLSLELGIEREANDAKSRRGEPVDRKKEKELHVKWESARKEAEEKKRTHLDAVVVSMDEREKEPCTGCRFLEAVRRNRFGDEVDGFSALLDNERLERGEITPLDRRIARMHPQLPIPSPEEARSAADRIRRQFFFCSPGCTEEQEEEGKIRAECDGTEKERSGGLVE